LLAFSTSLPGTPKEQSVLRSSKYIYKCIRLDIYNADMCLYIYVSTVPSISTVPIQCWYVFTYIQINSPVDFDTRVFIYIHIYIYIYSYIYIYLVKYAGSFIIVTLDPILVTIGTPCANFTIHLHAQYQWRQGCHRLNEGRVC